MKLNTMRAIQQHVQKARTKHPDDFPRTWLGFFRVLGSELCEVAWAAMFETPDRVKEELLDCVAVIVRRIEGDDNVKPKV